MLYTLTQPSYGSRVAFRSNPSRNAAKHERGRTVLSVQRLRSWGLQALRRLSNARRDRSVAWRHLQQAKHMRMSMQNIGAELDGNNIIRKGGYVPGVLLVNSRKQMQLRSLVSTFTCDATNEVDGRPIPVLANLSNWLWCPYWMSTDHHMLCRNDLCGGTGGCAVQRRSSG
jgi:hypothetical protein